MWKKGEIAHFEGTANHSPNHDILFFHMQYAAKFKIYILTHSPIHHFETVPTLKKLQTTTEMWLLKDFTIQIA